MRNILLIAGGGALGGYTEKELLNLGHTVDTICLEDKISKNGNLRYIKENATVDFLKGLFAKKHYDGIVNFLHYPNAESYAPYHELLTANTEHLIFLSSYRVYADLQHPITETAPQLGDVITDDEEFLNTETYALGKYRCEKYLNSLDDEKNWTVVRPVISFAGNRFDLFTYSGQSVLDSAKNNIPLFLPEKAKGLTAGLDWAGNSGKLIANLLFKKESVGEAYTVSSGQNLTWQEVAEIYYDILGINIQWIDAEEFIKIKTDQNRFALIYDRMFNRDIDSSKILKATGLMKSDFVDIKTALIYELKQKNLI